MDSKKVIETLIRIARNQQKIIEKLAQEQRPTEYHIPGQRSHQLGTPPPTQHFPAANHPNFDEGGDIFQYLTQHYPNYAALINRVIVVGSDVIVEFHPGKQNPAVLQLVDNVVKKLQHNKTLFQLHYNPSTGK